MSDYCYGNVYIPHVFTSVRPIMISDIGTSAVICNIGDERKGNCAPMSDAPNIQHLVYDVNATVGVTECNPTQAHSACEAVIK